MSRDPHQLHLTETQHFLAYGLEMHGMPHRTALRLAHQFTEAHVLREMLYFNYECGRRPQQPHDWRWLALRIKQQLPAPGSYPFATPD